MSTFSRRVSCARSTIVVASMLTAGATATAAAPGTPQLLDPDFEKPTIGECHNYGMTVANQPTDTSPVVPCGTTHTAKVLATPMLPASLTWETATADAMNLALAKACLPAFNSILGRTEKLRQKSAYDIVTFVPTQAQKDAGARWMRCDLVLSGGYSLQPITRNTSPILHAYPLPKSVTSCLVGPDDTIRRTVCSKTHRYRATGTWLVERTYYPGHDALLSIARNRCPGLVTTPRWWFAWWMTRNMWKAGDRTITCYSHTSS
jgi:hypothetical protein